MPGLRVRPTHGTRPARKRSFLLDGLAGYLVVAAQWQRWPLTEDDHWEEARLLGNAGRAVGDGTGPAGVGAGSASPASSWESTSRKCVRNGSNGIQVWRKERKPARSAHLQRVEDTDRRPDPYRALADLAAICARRLEEETLVRLAQDLLTETDRVPLLKLLHLFRERPFPLPIDRLLELAQGRDEDLAEAARWALGNLTDGRIRALAEQLWSRRINTTQRGASAAKQLH